MAEVTIYIPVAGSYWYLNQSNELYLVTRVDTPSDRFQLKAQDGLWYSAVEYKPAEREGTYIRTMDQFRRRFNPRDMSNG